MLYTRLSVCVDNSDAIMTRLAVHVIISHNCIGPMHDLRCYHAMMLFWISKNGAKWNIMNLITKHKNYKTEKNFTLPRFKPRKKTSLQYSTLWDELQRWIINLRQTAVKWICIFAYIYMSSFRMPPSHAYGHFATDRDLFGGLLLFPPCDL